MLKMISIYKERRALLKAWLPAILLVALYLSEAYFKILDFSKLHQTNLLKIFKAVLLFLLIIGILRRNYKALFLPVLLFIMFSIGQMTLGDLNFNIVIYISKYFYLLVFLIFTSLYSFTNKQKYYLFSTFEILILINSILIFIGFLFKIFIFKTYSGDRFGFNGLFITSATSSYVYAISIIYFYNKYKKKFFIKITNYILLLSAILIGTKSIHLFIIFFFLFYILKHLKVKKYFFFFISVILLFVVFYFFFYVFLNFNSIKNETSFLTSILSYRDILFTERTIPFIKENWKFSNFLFGGVNNLNIKSQMDFIDLFCFFGLFGGFLYLYLLIKYFFTFKLSVSLYFFFILLFFNIFFSGNFFTYPSIAVYLIVLQQFLIKIQNH